MEVPTRTIEGRSFWRVGELILRRDSTGSIIEYTHQLPPSVRPNAYADGPFCRFGLAAAPPAEGVYAVTVNDVIVYIGECVDLAQRFGATGYGAISPRNCHHDGQSTNCKVNSRVLAGAKENMAAIVWFFSTDERKKVEAKLLKELRPPWNGQPAPTVDRSKTSAKLKRSRPSSGTGSITAPTADDFQTSLRELLRSSASAGLPSLHVRAGDLHRSVGGYPGPNHRMPVCCRVMRAEMLDGDHIVQEPPKGDGANLVIQFRLPRVQPF